MGQPERAGAVSEILAHLRGLDPLKQLLWSELNYQRANIPLSRRGWSGQATQCLAEEPVLFATAGIDDGFHVVYARLAAERLLLGPERLVMSHLLRDHPYGLFIFSNRDQDHWHFVNAKYDASNPKRRVFRRITIGPGERLRTASERIALLDLALMNQDESDLPPLAIQKTHDEAFNVEAVTTQFFDDYKLVFTELEDKLARQTKDRSWAHDYSLQLLNRLMFLYFVQRKRWLGPESEFMRLFWESYNDSGEPKDSFFERWLKVLFFEAFNNRFIGDHSYFPDEIRRALTKAPYLNGGLFAENDLDRRYKFTLTDASFEKILLFLEHYNFTIAEDSPFDQEVAVDPEMIGKVYESLVNVSEDVNERAEAGIFYTPRTEIDIMCRLALVDYLSNHLGAGRKNLLYEAVFALDPEEKDAADRSLAKENLWPDVAVLLHDVTVVDPACGSGSFLVGMLNVLDDLTERADQWLGVQRSGFERKKQIIGQNLYGVDVMEWACHVAELRLWLALIVDAEFTREELHDRREPLLPHFSFKIRCGDSLVQEVGGINLGHSRSASQVSPALRTRIADLKAEKLKFYNNDPTCRFSSVELIRNEERSLFRTILDDRRRAVSERIAVLRRRIEAPQERQLRLDGTVEREPRQMSLQTIEWQQELDVLKGELDSIDGTRQALESSKEVPFVWDIAFVEIFEGEKKGFDIVIGNPPYVRQESISDPRLPRDAVTPEDKRRYKGMLARSVYQVFPSYFGYRPSDGTVARKLDAKSDLYIYFYFHGLSLLNPKGTFCFVTSNSWLDVAYGAGLQEFLLKHCHVKIVLDNQVKRSFASADINTIIVLFSAPDESREWGLDQVARFVMFKVPFEQVVLSVPAVIFEEIEGASSRKVTPEYRVHPVVQSTLLEEGCAPLEVEEGTRTSRRGRGKANANILEVASKYRGNKWGGKYLRAPDVYWAILEKGADKLVRLQDLAEVRFGIKTGANDFFYVRVLDVHDGVARIRCDDGSEHTIEAEYVREPVIVKAREIVRPRVDPNELQYRLVHLDRDAKKKPHAARYIQWGQSKGFHLRPTTKSRHPWWIIRTQDHPAIAFPMAHKRRPVLALLDETPVHLDNRLYAVYPREREDALLIAASLCSTFGILSREIHGRANFGQGMLDMKVYEVANLEVLNPKGVPDGAKHALLTAYEATFHRAILMLYDEIRLPDRRALDNAFLLALGFTNPGEREELVSELQEATCRMVWNRLAKSETAREARMTYDEWLTTGQPFGPQVSDSESDTL